MKASNRERIELHMLTSLARSQRALCRIIETIADQVAVSEQLAVYMAENLKTISEYQRSMIQKLTKQSPRQRQLGTPGKPWISKDVARGSSPAHD
ncbi:MULTISPECIES: hypothetical protein [unclassified Paenibacillus]|uniref:hypothetical protein n=1 Tax=unclassified Paenibacillus TaxID=185978 RepID=UPI000709BF18|nr:MULTISPECIES: hypothetical protein [unclassified Paenibacillus]KQX49158.1 hypothetical protein ASD40_13595 [Paenibacillus sp. Root444D2]KRE48666.1 hypothetical protein ASG85_26235 [Paenibacillus sp. Soil724D2]